LKYTLKTTLNDQSNATMSLFISYTFRYVDIQSLEGR